MAEPISLHKVLALHVSPSKPILIPSPVKLNKVINSNL